MTAAKLARLQHFPTGSVFMDPRFREDDAPNFVLSAKAA